MPNYLRAIARALSTVAGPLGMPAELVLSLYDDELAEKREEEIDALLATGQELDREVLTQLFEVKGELTELHQQLIKGLTVCIGILLQNHGLLQNPKALESNLPALMGQHQTALEENGFITKEVLLKELSALYLASPNLFLATVGSAGFPLDTLPQGEPLRVIAFHFLTGCSGLGLNQQLKIFTVLSTEKPSSEPLRTVTALLRERLASGANGVGNIYER